MAGRTAVGKVNEIVTGDGRETGSESVCSNFRDRQAPGAADELERRGDHGLHDAHDAVAVVPIHDRRGISPSADVHGRGGSLGCAPSNSP